jgi:hypothetical protein
VWRQNESPKMRMSKREAVVKRFAVTLLAMFGAAAPSAYDEASIPQQLRQTGSFERVIVSSYEPLQLADLVGRADLIVEASTPGGRSYLTPNGNDIYTDFVFDVQTIIKNVQDPDLRVGRAIVVRRDSGSVVIEGRTAVAQENDFPLFDRNDHYILFLTKPRGENAYVVVGGPQGAFSLREGAKQVAIELGDWSNKHGVVARAAFLDELRALLKFSS